MTHIIKIAIFGLLTFASGVKALAFPLAQARGVDSTQVAVYIEDLATGATSTNYNSMVPLIPASITKVITSSCVLSLLGADARFPTTVDLRGTIDGSRLQGDLLIHTTGDPTLGSKHFEIRSLTSEIVDSLRELGITEIEGRVIVDSPNRTAEPAPDGWEESDLSLTYGTLFHPSTYADNTFELALPSRRTTPPVPDLKLTQRAGKKMMAKKSTTTNAVTLFGPAKGRARYEFPNSSPQLSLAADVKQALARAGIRVKGSRHAADDDATTTLLVYRSERYGDIMRSLMHRSDNLFAEGMLITLSPWGGRSGSLAMERELLKGMGANLAGVEIEDGSGLSRNNRLTARFMADVLRRMALSEQADTFTSLFPRVGLDGTVKRLLSLSPLTGQLVLKSGSMKGVKCYAGYRLDEAMKPTHIVVIMVNGYRGKPADLKNAIECLLLNEFS